MSDPESTLQKMEEEEEYVTMAETPSSEAVILVPGTRVQSSSFRIKCGAASWNWKFSVELRYKQCKNCVVQIFPIDKSLNKSFIFCKWWSFVSTSDLCEKFSYALYQLPPSSFISFWCRVENWVTVTIMKKDEYCGKVI